MTWIGGLVVTIGGLEPGGLVVKEGFPVYIWTIYIYTYV